MKRTKQVFPGDELAHIWAHKLQTSGRRSDGRMFFDGATIYSYGGHFPIATLVTRKGKTTVLFTTQTYSSSTAKHISVVRSAVSHLPILYCCSPDTSFRSENVEHFASNIRRLMEKLARARKPEMYALEIQREQDKLTAYLKFFRKGISRSLRSELFPADLSKAATADAITKFVAKERERQAAAVKRGKAVYAAKWNAWRTFQDNPKLKSGAVSALHAFEMTNQNAKGHTFLRYNRETGEVETSKGIKIPKEVALRLAARLERESAGVIGSRFLDYPINGYNGTLEIGCHSIAREEIAEVVRAMA